MFPIQTSCSLFLFNNFLSPVISACVLMGMGASTEACPPYQEPRPLKKTGSHLLYRTSAVTSSSVRLRIGAWGLCISSSCVAVLNGLILCCSGFTNVVVLWSRRHCSAPVCCDPLQALTVCLPRLPWCSLSLVWVGMLQMSRWWL